MFMSHKHKSLTGVDLQEKINQLHQAYMPMDLSSVFYHSKVNAIKKLEYILRYSSRTALQDADYEELILCALTLVYFFDRAAELYKVGQYTESFREGVFEHVLVNLVGSTNALYSIVGCRLLHRFLDRQNNAEYLTVPSLYYEFSQVRLKVGCYDSYDKTFIRNHRDKFHEFFLKAVKLHCNNSGNLKAIFVVVCLVILEVPCGLTAAAAACIVMTIQDFALNGENLTATCRYWMHAIVISVMSLICWVHKAPVLYRYVNQIISRRAKEAPQLNPPLMQIYNIGRHHVTWNKPTLFFEDWELRYGLWKHFKDAQFPTKKLQSKLGKKAPSMDLRY
ncbi:protein EFR3 homolog A isoform X2 [Manduca sexta]|uniref:protein EFR3 homolog A isoform X2 n=1 Tax=Manduca sexta TaxID=7130 RepID=UPI00188FD80C|nr:protein EFR3 homolog A isoform X2 [Manduca sexta]